MKHATACKAEGVDAGVGTSRLWLPSVLSELMGFASISTDLYLPAMPTSLGSNEGTMELMVPGSIKIAIPIATLHQL